MRSKPPGTGGSTDFLLGVSVVLEAALGLAAQAAGGIVSFRTALNTHSVAVLDHFSFP